MDSRKIKSLRTAMESALSKVGEEFDIDISVLGITYGDDNFSCKIKGATKGAVSDEAKCYLRMATGDMPMLNDRILLSGKKFKVVGWNSRARKYPVLIKDNTGQSFKISRQALISAEVYRG